MGSYNSVFKVLKSLSVLDIRITKYFQKSASTPCISHIMPHYITAHGSRSKFNLLQFKKNI